MDQGFSIHDLLDLTQDVYSQNGVEAAVKRFYDDGWTMASLVEAYLKLCRELWREPAPQVPTLQAASRKKLIQILIDDAGYEENAANILESLRDRPELQNLLRDPCMPYRLLRKLSGHAELSLDFDEAVLKNDSYIRANVGRIDEQEYLVSAEQLIQLLKSNSPFVRYESADAVEARMPMPVEPEDRAHLLSSANREYWFQRHQNLAYASDCSTGTVPPLSDCSKSFVLSISDYPARRLGFATQGLTEKLPWDHVLMAGRGVLQMTYRPYGPYSVFMGFPEGDPRDIDLFIYGVNIAEANEIVKRIWQLYSSLKGPGAIMARDTMSITMGLPGTWKVKVFLRLFLTRTEVLSSVDVDAWAIGFDGSAIVMLPRCALAIETGASMLATELLCQKRQCAFRGMRQEWSKTHNQPGFRLNGSSRAILAQIVCNRPHGSALQAIAEESTWLGGDIPGPKASDRLSRPKSQEMEPKDRTADAIYGFYEALTDIEEDGPTGPLGWADDWPAEYMPDVFDGLSDECFHNMLRPEICNRLQVDIHTLGFQGYLKRRIRRVVYLKSPNEADFERRQVTIPVLLSKNLEALLTDSLTAAIRDADMLGRGPDIEQAMPVNQESPADKERAKPDHPIFIPVYNPQYHSPTTANATVSALPPLLDSNSPEEENLRFWITSHTSMWAGQNPMADEVRGIVECLVNRMDYAYREDNRSHCSREKVLCSVLRHIGRRLLFCKAPGDTSDGWSGKREEALFRAWVNRNLHRMNDDD